MIAGPFERLRHQQDLCAVLEFVALKMSAEKHTMHLVDLAIGEQDLMGKIDIAAAEAFADLLQHFL